MSIFIIILFQFPLTFFHHLDLVHKPLAVVLVQLDFENRLIQRNWTFILGLGLVLNNASSYDITMACDLLINVTLSVINVSFSAAFLKVFIQTIFLASN